MLFYALIGYLMYSALFVNIGVTVKDIQETERIKHFNNGESI